MAVLVTWKMSVHYDYNLLTTVVFKYLELCHPRFYFHYTVLQNCLQTNHSCMNCFPSSFQSLPATDMFSVAVLWFWQLLSPFIIFLFHSIFLHPLPVSRGCSCGSIRNFSRWLTLTILEGHTPSAKLCEMVKDTWSCWQPCLIREMVQLVGRSL